MNTQINTIGIIGYGHFGQFVYTLAAALLPEVTVRVFSRRAEEGDGIYTDLETACMSDVVILCGSIEGYEEQIESVVSLLRSDTVLVDVATVKVHTEELMQRLVPDQPRVSCHPMFGPESYRKSNNDVAGFRIVITSHTLTSNVFRDLLSVLREAGFVAIEMSADTHDRLLAETLFLTHYIGQTMKAGEFTRTPIDTVSFSYLMQAVESVQNDEQLFADVYRFNPYCREVAERFHEAQEHVFQKVNAENKK